MPRAARQSPSGRAEKFVHRITAIRAIPSSHVCLLVVIGIILALKIGKDFQVDQIACLKLAQHPKVL